MKTLKFITSLGIAAGVGLLIGMLTAPRKGNQTRIKLLNELDNTKEALELTARKKLEEAKKTIKKTVKKQQINGQEATDKIKEMVAS